MHHSNSHILYPYIFKRLNFFTFQNFDTLKGLSFDRYDGTKVKEDRRLEQQDRCLEESPGLLEIFGFSFSFFGLLTGPQYPLTKYRSFLRGELTQKKGELPDTILEGLKVGGGGVLLLAYSQIMKVILFFFAYLKI